MTTLNLLPHPASHAGPVGAIVAVVVPGDGLSLVYRIRASTAALRIPPPSRPGRRDGLWRHTCCELFVAGGNAGYREFNFSPSGEWAAWSFSGYRAGMRELAISAPRVSARTAPETLELAVELGADALAGLGGEAVRIALACVLEDREGTLAYWALAHGAARPDFHHPAGFAFGFSRAGSAS